MSQEETVRGQDTRAGVNNGEQHGVSILPPPTPVMEGERKQKASVNDEKRCLTIASYHEDRGMQGGRRRKKEEVDSEKKGRKKKPSLLRYFYRDRHSSGFFFSLNILYFSLGRLPFLHKERKEYTINDWKRKEYSKEKWRRIK